MEVHIIDVFDVVHVHLIFEWVQVNVFIDTNCITKPQHCLEEKLNPLK